MKNNGLPTTETQTTFKQIFENLSKIQERELREFVANDLGKRSKNTLRNWVNGNSRPNTSEKRELAKYLKQSVEQLFPE